MSSPLAYAKTAKADDLYQGKVEERMIFLPSFNKKMVQQ